MNRTWLSLAAICAALAAVTVVALGTGAASAAPKPAPTHVPDDPCESGRGVQELCDAAGQLSDPIICKATSGLEATGDLIVAPSTYDWYLTFSSDHSCPLSSGDIVRMSGTLIGDFEGIPAGQSLCTGYGSCGNSFNTVFVGGSAWFALALTSTASYGNPAASSTDIPTWWVYP